MVSYTISYLLYQCLVLYLSNKFKNPICAAQKRSVRALFAAAQQPHSRDIFNQKMLPVEVLINQQGILASLQGNQ